MATATGKAGSSKETPPAGEVHAFQAEMQQLLHIIIHSLYSEREIFLRELISNSADALNKYRFRSLTEQNLRDPEAELAIVLDVDAEAKTLTVTDTGIGMSRDEAISNLGTIARSGTLEFVKNLSEADPGKRSELIGQFGVGFYSVFMVAKRVVVDTCPADPSLPPTRWVSEGQGEYAIETSDRTTRGTSIRLELKDDAAEFAENSRLEGIVKRYSNFIPYPIRQEDNQLNTQDAIWAQSRDEVSQEEYTEFYKFVTGDFQEPKHTLHLSIDAPVQYRALLYVPPTLSNEVLYSPNTHGIDLYASKVKIQSDSKDLLPLYLRFLRGLVDTEDLPLNVSRETVQQNPLLGRLRTSLTGRVLRNLQEMADSNEEAYNSFWRQFGKVLKEGLANDQNNKARLLELFRASTSKTEGPEGLTTLKGYISRMQPDQNEIYYLTGPSRSAIERNPHLEYFRKHDLEVLYLTDQIDDFAMASMTEYEGKTFTSVDQADVGKLKEGEEDASDPAALSGEALDKLLERMKELLGERVTEVSASKRLVDSPAVLVSPDGLPGNLQKMMRMMNQDFQSLPKRLEVNASHALLKAMARIQQAGDADGMVPELVEQLYSNCMLVEGLVDRPEEMVGRIQTLMTHAATLAAGPEEEAK